MNDIEVHISLGTATIRVGTLFRQAARGRESVTFQYHDAWLGHGSRFSLEPGLTVGNGIFHPGESREMFGSIGDSAPDTRGRRLMQRKERRRARLEDRPPTHPARSGLSPWRQRYLATGSAAIQQVG